MVDVIDINAERFSRIEGLENLTPRDALRLVSIWVDEGIVHPTSLVISFVTNSEEVDAKAFNIYSGDISHRSLLTLVDAVTEVNLALAEKTEDNG